MKRIEYTIEPDSDPLNPRTEWDNVGTMVCWHRRYILGDEQPSQSPEEYIDALLGLNDIKERIDAVIDYFYYREDWPNLESRLTKYLDKARDKAKEKFIILPLYLYDHSGITISASPFSCPWDSGQVGFIYCTMEKAKTEWPDETRQSAIKYLLGEVETYDQYLTGEVYGYMVERVTYFDGEEDYREELESCWGFFGYNYCEEEAKSAVAYYENEREAA